MSWPAMANGLPTHVLMPQRLEFGTEPSCPPRVLGSPSCQHTNSDAPFECGGGAGVRGVRGREALDRTGPQRRPHKRLDRRLEEVAKSGWGRLLSVTNAIESGTCRQGDSGWA